MNLSNMAVAMPLTGREEAGAWRDCATAAWKLLSLTGAPTEAGRRSPEKEPREPWAAAGRHAPTAMRAAAARRALRQPFSAEALGCCASAGMDALTVPAMVAFVSGALVPLRS